MPGQSKDEYLNRNLKIYRKPVVQHKMTFTSEFKYGEVYRDENLRFVLVCLPCHEYCKDPNNCISYDNFDDFRKHLETCHFEDDHGASNAKEQDELERLMAGISKRPAPATAAAEHSLDVITKTLLSAAQAEHVSHMDPASAATSSSSDSSAATATSGSESPPAAGHADDATEPSAPSAAGNTKPIEQRTAAASGDSASDNSYSGELKCTLCQQTYSELAELDEHLGEHMLQPRKGNGTAGRRPFQCSYCGKRMNTEEVLLKHYSRYHEILPIDPAAARLPPASARVNEMVRCRVCQQCIRRVNLQNHLNMHDGKRPFECDYCGRSYRQKQTLRSHIKKFHQAEFHADAPIIHLSNNQLVFESQPMASPSSSSSSS